MTSVDGSSFQPTGCVAATPVGCGGLASRQLEAGSWHVLELQGTQPLRQRTGVLFVLVLVGHLILISAQVQSRSGVPVLEAVTFGRLFARPAGLRRGRRLRPERLGQLRRAARRARGERVAEAAARRSGDPAAGAARAGRADRAAQQLLDLQQSTALPTIAAEVIAGNPNPGILTVTVNRGSSDGVKTDMAVISPKGIVGRVVGRPAAHAARVQLLIDPAAAAAAR